MLGDAEIIELLNEVLTSELTAINQYFLHARMLDSYGYAALGKKKHEESIEEMKHADSVIARILLLDGVPNMQRLSLVRVGEDAVEMHRNDLALELEARERLNRGIALSVAKGDGGTRSLLESILKDEEESIDWLEAHLRLVETLGKAHYLAQHIRG